MTGLFVPRGLDPAPLLTDLGVSLLPALCPCVAVGAHVPHAVRLRRALLTASSVPGALERLPTSDSG